MGMSPEARREAIDKAMQAFAEPESAQERVRLPYKDGQEGPFAVISIPVDAVLYNHRSHRIKSQLESHPDRQVVEDAPDSDEAQDVIRGILAATEGFEALKADLNEYGQRDPGVVTREGLLVNANTRLAALRDLGIDYIRAALLPIDANEYAIDRLELDLQVRPDFRQNYTFTNELLFIDELLGKHDYTEERAAKALAYAASNDENELRRGIKSVRQRTRLLALVREIQGLGEGAIPLTYFDDKRQVLLDLDDSYQALKDSNPDGAERMKNARIAGILSGNFYRQLRDIDGNSATQKLMPRIEEKDLIGEEVQTLTSSPEISSGSRVDGEGGTEDDSDLFEAGDREGEREEGTDLLPLAALLARSYGQDEIRFPSGKRATWEEVTREFAEAIDETAEEVQADRRVSRNLNGPVIQLQEALNKAKAAAAGYRQVRNTRGFNSNKFEDLAGRLDIQVAAIKKAIEQWEG